MSAGLPGSVAADHHGLLTAYQKGSRTFQKAAIWRSLPLEKRWVYRTGKVRYLPLAASVVWRGSRWDWCRMIGPHCGANTSGPGLTQWRLAFLYLEICV
ncbi:hypothetical protein D9M72_177440 [compost metagenome]